MRSIGTILSGFILLLCNSVVAQPFCYSSRGAGQAYAEEARSITVDANGNVYTVGFYQSPSISFGATTINNSDNTGNSADIFIVKQDSCGNVLWAKSFGDPFYDDRGISVQVDNSGSIYLGGNYGGYTITFGSTTLINNLGSFDYFLTKLNSSGSVLWAKGVDNTGNILVDAISLDNKGSIYMTGSFSSDSLKFETDTLLNSNIGGGNYDAFLAKFNTSGNLIWAKAIGEDNSDRSYDVTTDDTYNVFIAGSFEDSISFGANKIYGKSSTDMFVVKCDSAGSLLWLKGFGGNNTDIPLGIDVDSQNNLYVTGYFTSDSIEFDSQKIKSTAWYSAGFLTKLDASGTALWATKVGGGVEDYSREVVVDKNDNPIIMGHYISPNIKFGSLTLTNATNTDTTADIFLAKYGSAGNFIWAKKAGGLRHDFSEDIAIAPNGTTYMAGEYRSSSITFGDKTITNNGDYDLFITNQLTQNGITIPDICMVTVDSASQYNNILWEKSSHTNVKNYLVYRETATNVYSPLAVIPSDSLSMFVDTVRTKYFPNTGNPNAGTYRYKLQVEDSAGNYGVLSPYHNTIYIVDNGSGTFSWNPLYTIEGSSNPVNSYEIMRDDDGSGNWQVVGSIAGTQNTISDPLYSTYPNGKWRVQTQWGLSCTPTYKTTTVVKSRSNVKNNFPATSGLGESDMSAFIATFPNPAHNTVTVSWTEKMNKDLKQIVLRNYMGVEVMILTPNENRANIVLDLQSLASGIYSIELKGESYNSVKRLIVN